MLPIRWEPIRELNTFQRELDDLFHRMFGVTREAGVGAALLSAPAINTYVKDNTFYLEADLPGVDSDKLDVRIDGHELVLRGERRETSKTEEADFLVRESRCNTFERRLTLPDGVDTDKIHATYKDGLLEITLPVVKTTMGGRKVPIEGLGAAKKSKEVH